MASVSYKEGLYKRLQDSEYAGMYIEEALNEGDKEMIRIAFQNVLDAQRLSLDVVERKREVA